MKQKKQQSKILFDVKTIVFGFQTRLLLFFVLESLILYKQIIILLVWLTLTCYLPQFFVEQHELLQDFVLQALLEQFFAMKSTSLFLLSYLNNSILSPFAKINTLQKIPIINGSIQNYFSNQKQFILSSTLKVP